jgi:hypothetical protein
MFAPISLLALLVASTTSQDYVISLPRRSLRHESNNVLPSNDNRLLKKSKKEDKYGGPIGSGTFISPANCTGPECATVVQSFSNSNLAITSSSALCADLGNNTGNNTGCNAGSRAGATSALQVPLGGLNFGTTTGTNGTVGNGTSAGTDAGNAQQEASDVVSETLCTGPGCTATSDTAKATNSRFFQCRGFDCFRFNDATSPVSTPSLDLPTIPSINGTDLGLGSKSKKGGKKV